MTLSEDEEQDTALRHPTYVVVRKLLNGVTEIHINPGLLAGLYRIARLKNLPHFIPLWAF